MELKESKVEMVDDDSVNKTLAKEKSLECSSNFEDHSFYNEEDNTFGGGGGCDAKKLEVDDEEEEIDVLECKGSSGNKEIDVLECNDGNDDVYSSSFSGTVSEHENESALNDQEADSMVVTDASLPFSVRKKKLTDHWRRFIQPIMWRCKWVELKIKQLQNQARMYDKELESSCQAKKLETENLKSEELGVKALPSLPCYSQKTGLKKRKKRKRVEDTSDVAAYTLNHNLFSYDEYRKSFADAALNENSRNSEKKSKGSKEETVFYEETPSLEFREGDAILEQILLKIEAAKLEVRNLKNRVDKVVNENPSRFSLNPLGSADVLTSSEQQKPLLMIKNEDEKPVISEEKSVSSHHDTQPEEDDDATDILLSDILASKRREGKAVVLNKKTEQNSVEEGPSRPARKRTPRNLDIAVKEETKPKRQKVSREKPKSNANTMASRFKLPNRKRKRGKRRAGSAGLRRRS